MSNTTDLSVNENTAYTAADAPVLTGTPIGTVTYTLGGTDALDFSIDSGTGVVSMVARDFEAPVDTGTDNTYALTITATDDLLRDTHFIILDDWTNHSK